MLWWPEKEILFDPLHRSSPFKGGQRWEPIQMGHSLHIRGSGGRSRYYSHVYGSTSGGQTLAKDRQGQRERGKGRWMNVMYYFRKKSYLRSSLFALTNPKYQLRMNADVRVCKIILSRDYPCTYCVKLTTWTWFLYWIMKYEGNATSAPAIGRRVVTMNLSSTSSHRQLTK
jgi:hypothetical protein